MEVFMKKNTSTAQESATKQARSKNLTERMANSEEKGYEYRKKTIGEDALISRVHHPVSKSEKPRPKTSYTKV